MGKRELSIRRDQQPGERYRVAAAFPPVHADNDLPEHPISPNNRVTRLSRAGARSRSQKVRHGFTLLRIRNGRRRAT